MIAQTNISRIDNSSVLIADGLDTTDRSTVRGQGQMIECGCYLVIGVV